MIRSGTPVADVLAVLESLGYSDSQKEELARAVEVVPRGYRFRALAVPSLDTIVASHDDGEPYTSIRRRVEVAHPFSFLPAANFFLLLVAAARTVYRDEDPREATQRLTRDSCQRFSTSVYAQPILLSAEGDFARFVEMQVKMPDFFQNFSRVEYERVTPCHVRLHYRESLSAIAGEYVLPGFWQGMFATFEVSGHVETTVFDAFTFELDLRWER